MVELAEKPRVYDPDETDSLPAQLYLACRPDEANGGLMLETRELSGQLVVLGYSTLHTFLAGCGADQPWILLPVDKVREIACVQEGSAMAPPTFRFSVAMDAPVPSELRGTAGDWADDEADWNESESPDWTTVHLASRPFDGRSENVELELQPMPGDLLAIMAYTSEAALRQGCGSQQAAAPVPAGVLGDIRRQCGAHTICLDTPLPERLRHVGEE
ncbi:hypothetical protein SAMN04487819_108279 [Actinopolyspora alba]|uniref:SseB protein N-terminal domain-containing protein n=1 Tax=Actinopolyspora alba TaxID=673379 RepID=A0A1I1Y9P9_9ACTN|nr:SAV_915 family protein [Actinopolyspora alba]SFE16365.1 hypothetical protein SAMN04487819_108279 [Actinopolyspora alba]